MNDTYALEKYFACIAWISILAQNLQKKIFSSDVFSFAGNVESEPFYIALKLFKAKSWNTQSVYFGM